MTDIEYQDQSASDLQLNLVQGAVDKNQLNVLCTDKIIRDDFTFEAGIIGASHYLELSNPSGEVIFTEVFACLNLEADRRMFWVKPGRKFHVERKIGDLDYENKCRIIDAEQSNGKFSQLVDMTKELDEIDLKYIFPGESESFEFKPMTSVNAVFLANRIKVQTLHCYPNEGNIVFTETVIGGLK
ncbi:DUF2617 family protein [Patescibacteria group bacterium]